MKAKRIAAIVVYALLLTVIANSWIFLNKTLMYVFASFFVLMNLLAGVLILKTKSFRNRVCHHGAVLLAAFIPSALVSVSYHIVLAFFTIPASYMTFIWSAVFCICVEAILFWNGIACIYLSSYQLGVKQRIIGAVCGMIPVLNLIVLRKMIRIVFEEVDFEYKKEQKNLLRADQQVCRTKYPIVMVHGICFRDYKYFNYWGRIPKELKQNGAQIYYGNHHSATSIKDSAQEITERVLELCRTKNYEKVNIIAHSKGGLDCRYAMDKLGLASYVASITTVNTPHRGCLYADYLLTKIDEEIQQNIARTYNNAMKRMGDENPDFLAAVKDLTNEACQRFNEEIKDPEGVYIQSIGSIQKNAKAGKFPLNLSYHVVKHFDGRNDGLVSENSFAWGEKYTLLEPAGKEGISHGDMIDLSRMNIEGFDVREFYVELVYALKNKGF